MRKLSLTVLTTMVVVTVALVAMGEGRAGQTQNAGSGQPSVPYVLPGVTPPAAPLYKLEDAFLRWPLPPGAEAYGWIEGKRMHRYVAEQAEIARRYCDAGHPQFWGRITGTSGDAESAEWMMEKFRRFGLTDVRMQPHDLEPQWMPRSWTVTANASGKGCNVFVTRPHPCLPGARGSSATPLPGDSRCGSGYRS
jgi:hypothetical protein